VVEEPPDGLTFRAAQQVAGHAEEPGVRLDEPGGDVVDLAVPVALDGLAADADRLGDGLVVEVVEALESAEG
jgi:hypothetical protein